MYTLYAKRYTLVCTRYKKRLLKKITIKKSRHKSFLVNKNDLLAKKGGKKIFNVRK